MSILAWLIIGALSGWVASIIMGTDARQGWLMNIVLGIIGAFVGGLLMNMLGQSGVNGFNLYSVLVSIGGAAVLLWVGRMVRT